MIDKISHLPPNEQDMITTTTSAFGTSLATAPDTSTSALL